MPQKKKERESKKQILHTDTSAKTQTCILQQHRQSACHYVGTLVCPSVCLSTRLSVCLSVGMSLCRSSFSPAACLCTCWCVYASFMFLSSLSACLYPSVYISAIISLNLSVYPSVCMYVSLSVDLRASLPVYLSVYPSVSFCVFLSLSTCLPIRLPTTLSLCLACLSFCLPVYPLVCLPCLCACLPVCLPPCLPVSLFFHIYKACLPAYPSVYLLDCLSASLSVGLHFFSVGMAVFQAACQVLTCLA